MSQTLLKRILIVCMVLAVIGVAVAGIYALTHKKTPTNANANTNTTNQTVNHNTNSVVTNTNTTTNTNVTTNTNTPVTNTSGADDQASVLRLARIFVERYGTFSNRNNFENITALEPFMTEAFQQQSAAYISEQQKNGTPADFYSITTTVASLEMVEYKEEDSAQVRIATRRVETKGSEDPTISTQYIGVTFENVSGSWKVSSAKWE